MIAVLGGLADVECDLIRTRHARDAYQDSPQHTWHLLRLWLKIENDWPIVDAILERALIYERVHRERSGRVPASALAGA
jgi:hypothetical protein